jgi:hypothetical protein
MEIKAHQVLLLLQEVMERVGCQVYQGLQVEMGVEVVMERVGEMVKVDLVAIVVNQAQMELMEAQGLQEQVEQEGLAELLGQTERVVRMV